MQRLQSGPDGQLDAIAQAGLLPRADADGRPLRADIAAQQGAPLSQAAGDAQG